MTLAWSNKAKFTPCERKVLAWANSNVRLPLNTLDQQQLKIIGDMVSRRLVNAVMADGTMTFSETELGQLAAMQTFMSPEQVANERIRNSRYESEALF